MEEQQENQEQPIKILETESLTAKVEDLIAQVEQLKRENEHLTRERYVYHNSESARREQAFAAFGQMPFLLDWVESVAGDIAMLKLDENLVSQDVDNAVEEAISDADLISQSDIESLIEFAIDEAKEEAQTIATDEITDLIQEAIDEVECVSHLRRKSY